MDGSNISIKCFDNLLFILFKLPNDLNKIIFKYYNNQNKCCKCEQNFDNLKKCLSCNLYLCETCHYNLYRILY